MARKKISEFRAKSLLYKDLQIPYSGLSINVNMSAWEEEISALSPTQKFVVKVDQGIKGRKKKGLVTLDRSPSEVISDIKNLVEKGFRSFIVEEFVENEGYGEHYLAIMRMREGVVLWYSKMGGIDIEAHPESITKVLVSGESIDTVASDLSLEKNILVSLLESFDRYHFSYLEINPLVIKDRSFFFLDTAVEVDTAGEFFVNESWDETDFRDFTKNEKTPEELAIEELKRNSPSSFSFQVINPNGGIFLLLSGGGASLVTADEVFQLGEGGNLANYGEYSGNPNQEETYIYVKNVLSLLLKSEAPKKALIIAGGVANFTDVRVTFKGVIQALSEVADNLKEQNVKVFVRRGGPHQNEGLALMREFLEKNDLYGFVSGPEMVLTDIVQKARDFIKN